MGTLSTVIENDIQAIVDSARAGDLTQRISLENKTGFYQTLSTSVNKLVDAADHVIADASSALSAMASGDLTHTITAEYQGAFGNLKDDINRTAHKITEVVTGIANATH